MNLILFIHASADGHLACSLVLAIGNGASVDIGVHVCFEGPFFPFDEVQLSVLSFPFGIMFFLSCGRPLCQARGPRGLLQLFLKFSSVLLFILIRIVETEHNSEHPVVETCA